MHHPRPAQHWPFHSVFLRDFEVVEEIRKGYRLFPHTEQLPVLSRAFDLEFYGGLPGRHARTDARGDMFRKLQLRELGRMFTTLANGLRPDRLHVQRCYTRDLVCQIVVVQQISETAPGGLQHFFRQYRGQAFLPDVHLSGKKIVVTSHAIDRFKERALSVDGHAVVELATLIFHAAPIPVVADGRPAFAYRWAGTLVVLPVDEQADRFVILTTLTVDQLREVHVVQPFRRLHLHYGPDYTAPTTHNIDEASLTRNVIAGWEQKARRVERHDLYASLHRQRFSAIAGRINAVTEQKGHKPGVSYMEFQDGIFGPAIVSFDPNPPVPPPPAQPPPPE